jgi:hypothetical protein
MDNGLIFPYRLSFAHAELGGTNRPNRGDSSEELWGAWDPLR